MFSTQTADCMVQILKKILDFALYNYKLLKIISCLDHTQIQLPRVLTMLRLTDLIIFWTLSKSNFLTKHEFSAAGSDSFFREVLSCLKTETEHLSKRRAPLTFKNRASYIWDGRTATLQMLHFIYFFNKYKY